MNRGYRVADREWGGHVLLHRLPCAIRYPLSAILLSVACSIQQPVPAAERPIRESMTLPVDSQVAKALLTVDEYLTDQRYEELTDLVLNLAETHGRELVAVPAENQQGVNRYLNVALHCQRILAELPPAGRAVCRSKLDPPAQRWYDAWQTTRDETHLERILRSAYVSRYGDNALWELGETAWDRGDYSLAAAYWSQLDPSGQTLSLVYPDPEFSVADVQARLILCEISALRFADAERRLEDYRERFAEADGTLAGRDGRWADLLERALAEAQTWKSRADQTIATFGGANERQRTWSEDLDLGPLRWTRNWPVRALPQPHGSHPEDRGPLKSFPIVDRQFVFVSDGEAIRAWNVVTGEPAWPNAQADPSIIYPSVPQEMLPLPVRPCVGVPWQTLTLHQGRLFARMGSPLAGAVTLERADQVSELVCLDVRTGEGKLVWKVSSLDLPAAGSSWSFEGTPLVLAGTAYAVLYRRQPEAEFALVALDAESGRVHWLRSLGSARPSVEEGLNRVSHLLLTSGDGRLYLSTDQGTILAMAPQDGRLLWAVSYESQPADTHRGQPAHLQTGLLPPVFGHGLLFVAPNDGRVLYCLEAASGRIVWQKPLRDRVRHILGVTTAPRQGRLLISGNSLYAINIDDGSLAWSIIQADQDERGYGQGLLTGQSVFWPTREWLFQVHALTGKLERKIPLRTPDAAHSGGNLAVADGVLIVVEADRIALYGEYSLLKERLQRELSQRPDNSAPWQRLMDLEASIGAWDAALDAGRQAWARRGPLSAAELAALQSRFTSHLWKDIQRKQADGSFAAAEDVLRELAEFPLSPEERGRLLWARSRVDMRRGEPAVAAARLHELLAIHLTTRIEVDGRPTQLVVREELERIREASGRQPFEEIHRRAERELAAALAAGDVPAVRTVIRHYPLLESAAEVWPRLIAEHSRRNHWTTVWPLFAEWESAAQTDLQRTVIAHRKVAFLKQAGYDRTAAQLEHRLAGSMSDLPAPWHYTVRDWQVEVLADQRPLMPDGSPPAEAFACALLTGTALTALDRNTGRERWSRAGAPPLIWAGYGETNLLTASHEALSAVSLETGEPVWQQRGERFGKTHDRFLAGPDRLILFDPARGVTAISTITGDDLWEFRPPRGTLQRRWARLSQGLLVQTLEPAAFWLIDESTGAPKRTEPGLSSPWRQAPVDFGDGRFGFVTGERQVWSWGPSREDCRKYFGAISQAHADPWLIAEGNWQALVVDGTTLVGLDPATGQRRWGTGLADLPVTNPGTQLAVCDGVAATAWSSQIRAVNLDDGKIAWEAPLPAGVVDWKLTTWCGQFAAMGAAASPAPTAVLLLLDPATGRPKQLLQQPCADTGGEWRFDDQGVLLLSRAAITAWKPMQPVEASQRGKGSPQR